MPPKRHLELDPAITQDQLDEYLRLKKAVEEKRAREEASKYIGVRRELLEECPHPLALAQHFEPLTVSTPAMDLLSHAWVEALHTHDGRLTMSMPGQQGKAVDCTVQILTTAGWSTMGDLAVGDEVFHPDGHPTRVTYTSPVRHGHSCYRVTTTDGRSLVVDGEHLWTVSDRRRGCSSGNGTADRARWPRWETLTTEQLLERGVVTRERQRANGVSREYAFKLPDQHAIVSKPIDLPIDPWLLGAWLGDGSSTASCLAVGDQDIDEMAGLVRATGARVVSTTRYRTAWRLTFSTDTERRGKASFRVAAEALGVWGAKHIPDRYLTAGTEQRLALLQGLLDTDGSITGNGRSTKAEFSTSSREIADGVVMLVRSLGWRVTAKESAAKIAGREVGRRWRVCFTPERGEMCPVRLRRKAERIQPPQSRSGERHAVSIASIEPVDSRPVRCIKVDRDDGLFLAGRDLVATHNTTLSRWAVFWALLDDPSLRVMYACYGVDLARESGREVRTLVEAYGGDFGLWMDRSHSDVTNWSLLREPGNANAGRMLAISPESRATGLPSDVMIVDDIYSGEGEANSPATLRKVEMWWESTARIRMRPGAPAVAIGTRFGENDLLGRFESEGWRRINIPALNDGETLDSIADLPGARSPNGYLISTRGTTESDWRTIRAEVGERAWASAFQGRPAPLEGGVWQRSWLDTHRVTLEQAGDQMEVAIFVDPADTGTGDEAGIIVAGVGLNEKVINILEDASEQLSAAAWARKACLLWLRWKADKIVAERNLGLRDAIPSAWQLLRRQAVAITAWGDAEKASMMLIEAGDAAAGDLRALQVIEHMADEIVDAGEAGPRLIFMQPKQSKLVRAQSVASLYETGRARMVGKHPFLEHQMLVWNPAASSKSPDRIDALALASHVLSSRIGHRSRVLV